MVNVDHSPQPLIVRIPGCGCRCRCASGSERRRNLSLSGVEDAADRTLHQKTKNTLDGCLSLKTCEYVVEMCTEVAT